MFSGTVGSVTWIELKQDPPGNDVKSDGTLTVTITNFDGKSFDWSSNIGVDAVYVKAGSAGSYLYIYEPPAESTGDTGLTTPGETGNEISHIAFCYDLEDPTTTTEPTTTTVEDTTTTSEGDTTTTTVDDTTTTSEGDTTTTSEGDTTTTTVDDTTTTSERDTTTTSSIPTDILPTSIVATTTPEVSPDTLPFTGSQSGTPAALALVLIAGGALVLVWARVFQVGRHE